MIKLNRQWEDFLEITKLEQKGWYKTLDLFIEEIYRTNKQICPDKENIFRMFNIMNPYNINVFMMFQDPYPQLRKGKCISNGIGLAAPYRTTSIKHFDEAIQILGKFDNTMIHLVNQGVFSINKYLTVEANKPLSHSESNMMWYGNLIRWDLFMKSVLYMLNKKRQNIVYIFFGYEASELSEIIDNENNLVIKTSHPSNKGYKYGLLYSNFAQKTNNYLKSKNKKEIQWKKVIMG